MGGLHTYALSGLPYLLAIKPIRERGEGLTGGELLKEVWYIINSALKLRPWMANLYLQKEENA